MKYVWLFVLCVCLTVSSVWAQSTISSARSLGMGGAVIGVADDGAAWYQNPAGLAALQVPVAEGKLWGMDVLGIYANVDDGSSSSDSFGLLGSGWNPAKRMGLGAGFGDIENEGTIFGAGFGMGLGKRDLSVGLSIVNIDYDDEPMIPAQYPYGRSGSDTLLNLGFLYQVKRVEGAPVRLGLVLSDITDETNNGPMIDLGVAWPTTPNLLLAADIRDLTDKTGDGPYFSVGAEYTPMKYPKVALRAGLIDTGSGSDWTFGGGYRFDRWRLDFGYGDIEDGLWSLTAGTSF